MPKQPKMPRGLSSESLARSFARLGWIGFWLQIALAALPILLLIYLLFRGDPAVPGRGVDLREYVAFGSLLVLVFSTLWCHRYTRVARRLLTPELRPPPSSVLRTVWIGVVVTCLGAIISVLLLLAAVGQLLFVFMLAPQGGVPVFQTAPDNRATWVSAIDIVDLMALVFTITAELTVLAFSLWLLSRTLRWAATDVGTGDDTTVLDEEQVG